MSGWHVVKVGGSLFDWPELPARLRAWIREQRDERLLLIAGGGPFADAIRQADARWNLGAEASHWLAVDAMGLAARLLKTLLPEADYVAAWEDVRHSQDSAAGKRVVILDVKDFLRNHESHLPPQPLPRDWSVTSDSIAARVAQASGARRLTVLKSRMPPAATLAELAQSGYVDEHFPSVAAQLGEVRFADLRHATEASRKGAKIAKGEQALPS